MNLKSDLWKAEYDPEEFAEVLHGHYSVSRGSSEETSYGSDDNPALTVRWTEKGTIDSIIAGPAFVRSDIAALKARLTNELECSGIGFWRYILHTNREVKGAIGFKGWFQLLPAPDEAPRSPLVFAEKPVLLEVQFENSASGLISMKRAHRAAREVELVLSGLLTDQIVRTTAQGPWHWLIDPDDRSKFFYAQEGYEVHHFNPNIAEFTDISAFADITEIPVNDYYLKFRSPDFTIPDTFGGLLQRFRKLDQHKQKTFLRGSYWLQKSTRLQSVSYSAAFMALVHSIEALMAMEPKEACEACGARGGQGSRQGFSDFVDRLTGSSISKRDRTEFYDLRSALSHGRTLLVHDQDDLMAHGPRYLRGSDQHNLLSKICYIVFHNWLEEQR